MKIMFKEKDFDASLSKIQHTFTSFSIPQIEHPYKYQEWVEQIMEFMMPWMLFWVNPNSLDSALVKKCIKNILVSSTNADVFNNTNQERKYPNSELYDDDPKITRYKSNAYHFIETVSLDHLNWSLECCLPVVSFQARVSTQKFSPF